MAAETEAVAVASAGSAVDRSPRYEEIMGLTEADGTIEVMASLLMLEVI